MRLLLGAVLIVVPLLCVVGFLFALFVGGQLYYGAEAPVELKGQPATAVLAVALLFAIDVAVHLLPLHFLRRLFGQWSEGQLLTKAAATSLRATGIALMVAGVIGSLLGSLAGPLISSVGGAVQIGVLELDLASLIAGAVVYMVGMVMDEAARVAEDAELTV